MRGSRATNARSYVDRVEQGAADFTWVFGRVRLEGPGETTVTVQFPVVFSEKPIPFLGAGEVDGVPEPAMFPVVNAVVSGWALTETDRYRGAELVVRATGRPSQELWVSWAFAGTALSVGGGTDTP